MDRINYRGYDLIYKEHNGSASCAVVKDNCILYDGRFGLRSALDWVDWELDSELMADEDAIAVEATILRSVA